MKLKNETEPSQNKQCEAAPSEEARLQPAATPSHEEIRRRAYEIHVERGGVHGQDVDDWLQAERELKTKYQKACRAKSGGES